MGLYGPDSGTKNKKAKGPSNINRLFDVLQRGQYASAEGARRLIKTKGNLGEVGKGVVGGLAGKNKTSYSTVLKESGVKGPLGAIGGFVGDVALDPTTYLTLGTGAVAKTGAKAVGVKFAGKEIAKFSKLHQAGSAAKQAAAKTKVGEELSKTFNAGHGLTPEIRAIQQKEMGKASMDVGRELQVVHDVFTGTTKKERLDMGYALKAGTVHTLDPKLRDLTVKAYRMMGGTRIRKRDPAKVIWHGKPEDIAVSVAKHVERTGRAKGQQAFREEAYKKFRPDIEANPELQKAIHTITRTFNPDDKLNGYWVRHFDKVQNLWKTQATVLNPGHHVRNLMGDSYMNFMAGVHSLRPYKKSLQLTMDSVPDDTIVRVGKFSDTKANWKRLYDQEGLRSGYVQSENLLKNPTRFKKVSWVLGKVASGTDKREDFARYANFLDAIAKQSKKGVPLEKAAELAAVRVRKYNFDYADLSPREQKFFKRSVPFYTYTRKALPRQLELLFTKPGKMAMIPKGSQAISQLLGVDTETDEPLPGLKEALPPWYEDVHTLPVGNEKVVAPSLPVDILGQFAKGPGGLVREAVGRASPLAVAPIELSLGRTLDEGFSVKDPVKYTAEQLSWPRLIHQQVTNKEKKREKEVTINIGGKPVKIDERQINWLTGAGIHKIGPPPSKRKGSYKNRKKGSKLYGTG